ncbi:MAG: hypothetical protein LUQ66_08270 [Methanoregula sp.]|nr:hypothetical protein [Methanoregula sp.]
MHEQSHSTEKKAVWTRKAIGKGIFIVFFIITVFIMFSLLGIIVID